MGNDTTKPLVGILMGSSSDLTLLQSAFDKLTDLGIPYEKKVISAHRTPCRAVEYASTAEQRGIKVIIAAAGFAAHLAGFVAAHTTLPVIGIPVDSSPLNGMDALLATVQMPGGVPVATVSIGKAGATNAAILAGQILALSDKSLAENLKKMREKMTEKVIADSRKVEACE
ncbi:MAG: 5-(carboxyamino)imidazole ribonucleotide mutase [Candidatus Auribacterota bacterium]|jgi:phosphoribosylaminoimidazole carboxylase PurE protein|nr:5-(carboxyamino)imidazole ribonucleotide mutase [Candidatus Auribacterota bacterium]